MKCHDVLAKIGAESTCVFAKSRKHYAWYTGLVIPTTKAHLRKFTYLDLLGKKEVIYLKLLFLRVLGREPEFILSKSKYWARCVESIDLILFVFRKGINNGYCKEIV